MNRRYDHLHVSLQDAYSTIHPITQEMTRLVDQAIEAYKQVTNDEHLIMLRKNPGVNPERKKQPAPSLTRLSLELDLSRNSEYSRLIDGLTTQQQNMIAATLATAEPSSIYGEDQQQVTFDITPGSEFNKHLDQLNSSDRVAVSQVFSIGMNSYFHKSFVKLELEVNGGNQ
ncbi:hypothetical protein ACXZ1M_24305 [Duganella sp. PWIR1]